MNDSTIHLVENLSHMTDELIAERDRLAAVNKKLVGVLGELVSEIDCLNDIQVSRDTEQHKAQACWDYALEQARAALAAAGAK